jgi:hypothetical protein
MDKHDKRHNPKHSTKHDATHPTAPTTTDAAVNKEPTVPNNLAPVTQSKKGMKGRPFSDN